MTSILILGASGLVGAQALALALHDGRVDHVVAPTRRALATDRKLENPIVVFGNLPADAAWWAVDGAICALGTTRARAGSAEASRVVDYDYPLAAARLLRRHGANRFALTSSMGADARSRFSYTRTKGELEDALDRLGFRSLTLVRPGLIDGQRQEFRAMERISGAILQTLEPLLPRRYQVSPVRAIAKVLVDAAVAGDPGRHVFGADSLRPT